MQVTIVPADEAHLDELARLAHLLWPHAGTSELREEFAAGLGEDRDKYYVAKAEGRCVGFIHMHLRVDYVEGSRSSPVGYVEGLYVEEAFRHRGVARLLLEAGEQWAKDQGCTELGSDTELDNVQSREVHRKLGFREVNKIVAFMKDIRQ